MPVYRKVVSGNKAPAQAPAGAAQQGNQANAPARQGNGNQPQQGASKPATVTWEERIAEFADSLKANKDRIADGYRKSAKDPLAAAENAIADMVSFVSDPEQAYTAQTIVNQVPLDGTINAMVKLAAMGLSSDTRSGMAYMTPRKNRRTNTYSIAVVPGVRGMEQKLMETGQVAQIRSQIVREQDVPFYEVDTGTNASVKFRRNLRVDRDKPNDIVAAFGYVEAKDGRCLVVEKVFERNKEGVLCDIDSGRSVNSDYMDEATSARYMAQRAAMREAAHTLFHDFNNIRALFELESEELSKGEEIPSGEKVVKQDAPALPEAEAVQEAQEPVKEVAAGEQAESPPEQTEKAEEARATNPLDATLKRVEEKSTSVTGEDAEEATEESVRV